MWIGAGSFTCISAIKTPLLFDEPPRQFPSEETLLDKFINKNASR